MISATPKKDSKQANLKKSEKKTLGVHLLPSPA